MIVTPFKILYHRFIEMSYLLMENCVDFSQQIMVCLIGKDITMEKKNRTTYVYILQCNDQTYYTGLTTDPQRRLKEHQAGGSKAARYTRSHGVQRFCCCWEAESYNAAAKLEAAIKKLPRAHKEDLMAHPEKLCKNYATKLKEFRYRYHAQLPEKTCAD